MEEEMMNATEEFVENVVDTATDTTMDTVNTNVASFWDRHPNLNMVKAGAFAGVGVAAAIGLVKVVKKIPDWARSIADKRRAAKLKKKDDVIIINENVDE